MPWWIWLLITIFMLCMIAAGLTLVVLSAIRLAKTCCGFSQEVASRFDFLNEDSDAEVCRDPLFTQPIAHAAHRYERTRTRVVERHERIREKHRLVWQHWQEKSLREEDVQL